MTSNDAPTPDDPADDAGPDDAGDFPLRSHLGMTLARGREGSGHCLAHLVVGPEHLNPNGVCHGAVLFAMVDTAMGGAVVSTLASGQICASIEVQLRFFRPILPGTELTADTRVVRRGRTIVHLESKVEDGNGHLVATATGSFAVIQPDTAPAASG